MDSAANALQPDIAGLLANYKSRTDVADELLQPDGTVRPVWQPLLNLLARETPAQHAARFARGDQYLRDTGVYFRQHSGAGSTERDWPLGHVPVMIDGREWASLSEGIVQRAELLERVMADLYGPASLISNGLLPAELIARNREWLRPMVGIKPPSGHFLHFLAFEIGRSPDGSWFVLGDRTQAPSGAGFALENRMATSRMFPDLFPQANVERLAGFFRRFRDQLNALRHDNDGRVAILTPGQHTDTYFEHAYIARYLGFLLLEASEMTLSQGRLSVQTINGPEPLNVVWRRLDSRSADPLELDETSVVGTPGMVSALRSGALTMANCLGSGVLETRALLAFLPQIAQHLLGEPLKLPNTATWWCGQASERDYVRANLNRMMIGPALSSRLPFDPDASTALGGKFRGGQQPDSVGDWLAAQGGSLVGQEAVTLSTTPAMIDHKLVPRPMMLRVFAARTRDGWAVMPGGYARIGKTEDPTALTMQAGGAVADVWVVSDRPVGHDTLKPAATGRFTRRMPGLLPARAADDLFWLGRYVERAEAMARVLRAYHQRLDEAGGTPLPATTRLADMLTRSGVDCANPVPVELLQVFDQSLACASKIRDRFSIDAWNALNDLSGSAHDLAGRVSGGDDASRAMSVLLRKLAGFSGLVHENMFRFTGWRFLTMGRAIERALQSAGFLADCTDPEAPPGCLDIAVELGDSVMTHRRRYSVETNIPTVIDLLVLDGDNPRSIRAQVDILRDQDAHLPPRSDPQDTGLSAAARLIMTLQTALAVADPGDISCQRLNGIGAEISAISEALSQRYLG